MGRQIVVVTRRRFSNETSKRETPRPNVYTR